MIRTLIVDDEPLAREGLRTRLTLARDVTVVGEAADGPSAVEAIRSLQPDLVFLDVQMPGMDGFEVLRSIAGDRMPAVIFVTAFDRYALRAFEVHALDYLLKPYPNARFAEALDRARLELERTDLADRHERIRSMIGSLASPNSPPPSPGTGDGPLTRLTVRKDDRFLIVGSNEIEILESAGNYVRVHARGTTFQLRSTLRALEEQLDSRIFVRIHRSTIVNADRIAEVKPEWHGDFDVTMTSGATVRMSRTFRRNLIP